MAVVSDHGVSEKNFMGEPVIGGQYCLPNTLQYTLVQTKRGCCTENWSVIDATDGDQGTVVFTLVKTNTNSRGWIPKFETQLVDAHGNIIARFKHKGCGTWKVFGGDNYDVLCSAKDCCPLFEWKTALKVFLASSMSREEPDYRVKFKNIYGKDHIIFHGTQSLAEVAVKCRWFGRPTYTVTVNAGADCVFVLLLVMIMEKRAKEHQE
ncbi:unnamed protein product [Sphagnum jensenii]|uniref:Uncharacterized protein n=1 Tax=Sphagnum jensenii TaxID=128206 RepID=A0ABP1BN02_9BRYO